LSIEINVRIVFRDVVGGAQRLVPVIAGEDLVGALAALDNLHMLRHLLGEEIEADRVMAHHWLGHRLDRAGQGFERSIGADADLVMIGAEFASDQIRIVKLIAANIPDALKADRKSLKARLAVLGQQRDEQRTVQPAG